MFGIKPLTMKRILILFFLLQSTLIGFSQDIKLGIFAAPKISWLSTEAKDASSDGSTMGFEAGLSMDKYFAKNYAFSTGISIGKQGGNISYDNNSSYSLEIYDSTININGKKVRYDIQYLTVPVGLRLRSNEIGYFRIHVLVGLTNQLRLKAKATDNTGDDFNKDPIESNVDLYNLSYHFGGGIDYALGEDTSAFCSIVYENGFLDVMKKTSPRVLSRVISLRLGIYF